VHVCICMCESVFVCVYTKEKDKQTERGCVRACEYMNMRLRFCCLNADCWCCADERQWLLMILPFSLVCVYRSSLSQLEIRESSVGQSTFASEIRQRILGKKIQFTYGSSSLR